MLDRAALLTLEARSVWPSAAQALKFAEQAMLQTPLERFGAGTLPYRMWLSHYRAKGMTSWARDCEARPALSPPRWHVTSGPNRPTSPEPRATRRTASGPHGQARQRQLLHTLRDS